VRKGRPAGGLVALQQPEAVATSGIGSNAPACAASAVEPASSPTAAAAQQACSKAAATTALQQANGQQQQQQQALPRPAFTSAAGVVVVTCSSTSPAVIIRQQFAQQQQQQQQQDSLFQVQQLQHNTGASCVVQGCSQPAAAVDTSANGLRQFKTLDQLLPPIKTVRLRAA
jgi:hypothetical protein